MRDIRDFNLLRYNTFGIDAKCKRFVEFSSVAEAVALAQGLGDADYPLLILGRGSNLLLTGDYNSTVVHSAIKDMDVVKQTGGHVWLRCGSGNIWDEVVEHCVANGWHGMENLSYIPGTVGASAVQNIGAYGAEAKDVISEVEAVEISTGRVVNFNNDDCRYAYRDSIFKHEYRDKYIITHVTYRLSKQFSPSLEYGNITAMLNAKGISQPTASELRQTIIEIRKAKLPDYKVEGNAGSFFVNPIVDVEKFNSLKTEYPTLPHYVIDAEHIKIPAGWMIEQCGWKGKTLGAAGVYAKQALVLVNKGGATGKDILNLCNAVRADVYSKFGIDIHPEVNIK